MPYTWDFIWVVRYLPELLWGLALTVLLTAAVIASGGFLGLLVFFIRRSRIAGVRWLAIIFIEVFRGLPVLVTLIWCFFCLPILLGGWARLSPFSVAILGLGLNFAALFAEIIRAGYEAIPAGEIEAARALNFTPRQTLWHIAVPQAFWRSLAPGLGQVVNTLKLTALASFIAVPEVFFVASDIIRNTSRPLEFYTALAALYLAIIIPFSVAVQILESHLTRRFRHA